MPPVKSLDRISEKWTRVVAVSGPDYQAGVQEPRTDWKAATVAAAAVHTAATQKALAEKRFEKGVAAAGTKKWQDRTLSVGVNRWTEGVSLSRSAYENGFAPYRAVIESVKLPDRGAKGDPKNINRVAAIANALHAEKLKRVGG
jgi:hypothetical protein